MTKTKFVAAGLVRPLIEPHLPDWVEPHWFMTKEEALALAPLAEIGWFDMYDKADMAAVITAATKLKWLNSIYAGVDGMPLAELKKRGTKVTNGAGINAITIAEYVVMGMLTVAKGYRDVVRAQSAHEWLIDSPGKVELYGSKALLLGYGAIGKLIEERLRAFNVDVTIVRRTPGPTSLAPDAWQARLGEFDWVILAVPATPETDEMIGADELAAMKQSAVQYRARIGGRSGCAGEGSRRQADWWCIPRCDHARTAPRRSSALGPRQLPYHHAPVGPRAGQDVRAFGREVPCQSCALS
jgi:lactate dehydrogenase-like 2-hydroxyacid dehydrogenase